MPEESEDGFDVLDLDADTGEFDVEESELEKVMKEASATKATKPPSKIYCKSKDMDDYINTEGMEEEFALPEKNTEEEDDDYEDALDLKRKRRFHEHKSVGANESSVHGSFGIEPLLKKKHVFESGRDAASDLRSRSPPGSPFNPSILSDFSIDNLPSSHTFPSSVHLDGDGKQHGFASTRPPDELRLQLAQRPFLPAKPFLRHSFSAKLIQKVGAASSSENVHGHAQGVVRLSDISHLLEAFLRDECGSCPFVRPLRPFKPVSVRTGNALLPAPSLNDNHEHCTKRKIALLPILGPSNDCGYREESNGDHPNYRMTRGVCTDSALLMTNSGLLSLPNGKLPESKNNMHSASLSTKPSWPSLESSTSSAVTPKKAQPSAIKLLTDIPKPVLPPSPRLNHRSKQTSSAVHSTSMPSASFRPQSLINQDSFPRIPRVEVNQRVLGNHSTPYDVPESFDADSRTSSPDSQAGYSFRAGYFDRDQPESVVSRMCLLDTPKLVLSAQPRPCNSGKPDVFSRLS